TLALVDGFVLRMVVFMRGFLLAPRFFGNTQNCVRMLLTSAALFCFKGESKDPPYVALRSTRHQGSTRIASTDAARSRSSLLALPGRKQPRYRRHSGRKDGHHLQAR